MNPTQQRSGQTQPFLDKGFADKSDHHRHCTGRARQTLTFRYSAISLLAEISQSRLYALVICLADCCQVSLTVGPLIVYMYVRVRACENETVLFVSHCRSYGRYAWLIDFSCTIFSCVLEAGMKTFLFHVTHARARTHVRTHVRTHAREHTNTLQTNTVSLTRTHARTHASTHARARPPPPPRTHTHTHDATLHKTYSLKTFRERALLLCATDSPYLLPLPQL